MKKRNLSFICAAALVLTMTACSNTTTTSTTSTSTSVESETTEAVASTDDSSTASDASQVQADASSGQSGDQRTLHPIRMVLHRKNRTTTMRREIPTAHRLISRTVTTQVSPAADLAVQAK